MEMGKQEPIECSCKEIAYDVAFLQYPREEPAFTRGQRFKCQCSADAPFTAHCDTEKRSADQEAGQGGSKGRCQLEDGKADDIQDQRGPSANPLGQDTEDKSTQGAHYQCPEDGLGDLLDSNMKVCSDRFEAYR